MAGRLLDLLSGERLEKTQRNMRELIEGTDRLVKEMEKLIKALRSHEKVMRELLTAIEESKR